MARAPRIAVVGMINGVIKRRAIRSGDLVYVQHVGFGIYSRSIRSDISRFHICRVSLLYEHWAEPYDETDIHPAVWTFHGPVRLYTER